MKGKLRGITLIELLTVAVIMALLTIGITEAYVEGINYDAKLRNGRADLAKVRNFEDKIADVIRHVELSTNPTTTATTSASQASYFIGNIGNVAGVSGSGTPTSSIPIQSASSSGSGNADTLIVTTSGRRVPATQLESDDDFETQNQNHGPIGGIHEISISTTAVGSPPNNQSGVFVRDQTPADSDPSQGGNEALLEPDVTSLQFEFWDGAQYDPTWDTRSMTPARLPAAVRITYRLNGDDQDHIFVVMVPASDVTAINPVAQTGTSTTP